MAKKDKAQSEAAETVEAIVLMPVEELPVLNEPFDIKELKKKDKLEIKGIEDTKGYEAVKSFHIELKKLITRIDKRRKELKEPAIKYGQAVDKYFKEIMADLEELRDNAANKRKFIEDEKARIKREEEQAEERRIQKRKDDLFAAGCTFDGVAYVVGEVEFPEEDLILASDEDVEVFLVSAKREKKRLDKIEEDKRKEQEARDKELEELRAFKEEQERKAAEEATTSTKEVEELPFIDKLAIARGPVEENDAGVDFYKKKMIADLETVLEKYESNPETEKMAVGLLKFITKLRKENNLPNYE